MTNTEAMLGAYIEAIYFTETGDTDQPPVDAEITMATKAESWQACRNFLQAIGSACGEDPVDGFEDLNMSQLGHDLWLTRNGHGCGFWDRPEIYGKENAVLFTRIAKAMGEHIADFQQDGDQDGL